MLLKLIKKILLKLKVKLLIFFEIMSTKKQNLLLKKWNVFETMEKVLADIDKVIIEKNAGSGVVPYLLLPV